MVTNKQKTCTTEDLINEIYKCFNELEEIDSEE